LKKRKKKQKKRGEGEGIWVMGEIELVYYWSFWERTHPYFYYYLFISQIDLYNSWPYCHLLLITWPLILLKPLTIIPSYSLGTW